MHNYVKYYELIKFMIAYMHNYVKYYALIKFMVTYICKSELKKIRT